MYQNKWALITGTSAEISAEFAKRYAQLGCNVVLSDYKTLASELKPHSKHHLSLQKRKKACVKPNERGREIS